MADQGIRLLDIPPKANTALTDQVVVVWNAGSNTAQTALVSVDTLTKATFITDPSANNVNIVSQGQMFVSNGFLYVANANNHLKRIPLVDF